VQRQSFAFLFLVFALAALWVHFAAKLCTIGVLSENVRPKLNTDVGVK
jgi:hypothetical protein